MLSERPLTSSSSTPNGTGISGNHKSCVSVGKPAITVLIAICVALFTSLSLAADITGRVVGVSDGDTITVLHSGKGERIRLHGIDCPEKRQASHFTIGPWTSKK